MAKKIGENLKYTLLGAAETVKSAVKESKISETIQEKAKEVSDKAKELPEKAKDLTRKKEPVSEQASDQMKEEPVIQALSTKSALKIIYYLMSADGDICHGEMEKFELIGQELDPNFKDNRESLEAGCMERIELAQRSADYLDEIKKQVESAINTSQQTADSYITPKLLIWDLLTIAYSDEKYDAAEKEIVRYIVDRLRIDETLFLEMGSSIATLLDLENELKWIKTTDRPYLTIEGMVNEIEDRKQAIFESVKDLISL